MTRDMSGGVVQIGGLLHGLHAPHCDDGREFVTCRPVVLDGDQKQSADLEVIVMAWCGDCHCAEWDWV